MLNRAHNDAMGTAVVAACDGPKSLLPSSIPLKVKNMLKIRAETSNL